MSSFHLFVYFPFRYETFNVGPEMFYATLTETIFNRFNIGSNTDNAFLLQIYDIRHKLYIEFDDEYINQWRKRLPRTSVENLLARIVYRKQLYVLSQERFFSAAKKQKLSHHPHLTPDAIAFSSPPYRIVWLDEYFCLPRNFRSMKKYLFIATQLEGPICDLFCHDIDNLIRDEYEIDFDLPTIDSHLKMFIDADQCRDYIDSRRDNSILLITSDAKGKEILPIMYDRIWNTYVLRSDWHDYEWGLDYTKGLLMFDDDRRMLTRIIRDIAQYFVDEASQLPPEEALTYLTWAKKLYTQADRGMFHKPSQCFSAILDHINHQLHSLEVAVKAYQLNQEDEDE